MQFELADIKSVIEDSLSFWDMKTQRAGDLKWREMDQA